MTDDLRAALLELERHAPDTESVRASVHRGIRTRARHKRLATVAGAAATVIALAAGAVVIAGGFDRGRLQPAPPRSALVPLDIPEAQWPFDDAQDGWKAMTTINRDGSVNVNRQRRTAPYTGYSIAVSQARPPTTPHQERITVGGHDATLQVNPAEGGAGIVWQLPSRTWVAVDATSVNRAKEVAAGLKNRDGTELTLTSPIDVGLAPAGYRFESVTWTDPAEPVTPQMRICSPGNDACYHVDPYSRDYFRSFTEGPEPPAAAVCRHDPNPEGPMAFGKRRVIDGSPVRLSSDGCFAARYLGAGKVMMLTAPDRARLSSTDFARMAASITLG